MAFKNFTRLTSRRKSSLVSQINKLIQYYSLVFPMRQRTYIDDLTEHDGAIYWLEAETNKLIAMAIVDPNYIFHVNDMSLHSVGFTISKIPGQMERILSHILQDYSNRNIILFCRNILADSFVTPDSGLVRLSAYELLEFWPDLANQKSDFFNLKNETIAQGLDRRQYSVYLKLIESDLNALQSANPELFTLIQSRSTFQNSKQPQTEKVFA